MEPQNVILQNLGTRSYQPVWDYQEELLQKNLKEKAVWYQAGSPAPGANTTHYLLLCEHPPVYTLGKSGQPEHLLVSEQELAIQGIEYYKINRGGDITFHGPGQIVGYPILDLERFYTDIGRYLRNLEEVIIRVLAHYGILGARSAGETGVWIDPDKPGQERKICAMGVRCSRWITMHGFAFNVNTPLHYFEQIIPCGIVNKQVTSLEKELGHSVPMEEVILLVQQAFESVFQVKLIAEYTGPDR